MNFNSTPSEFPIWDDGVIYDPVTPGRNPKTANPPELQSKALVPRSSVPAPLVKTPSERHTRKCAICNHEDREAIEESYLNWTSPEIIARRFDLGSHVSVYRHVDAVGLAALRRRRKLAALDLIIEFAGQIRPTAGDIIRAIVTSSRIGEDGEYVEPVRRTHVTHTVASNELISNRKPNLLETP